MTGSAVTVYVPCDVVEVQVRVGYGDSLSAMEEVVLRAVHAGQDDVAQLAEALGLARRLVNDFVYDLWRQDHLVIDPTRRTVRVSSHVARCLDAGRPEILQGGEASPEARKLMVDQLTGWVRPAVGRTKPGEGRLAVPVDGGERRLQDAAQADVLTALNASSRRHGGHRSAGSENERDRGGTPIGGRTRSVRSFRIPPRDLQPASGQRWSELKVRPTWDEESERLVITVVDDTYPAQLREPASERLTRLAAESPTRPIFIELRKRAESRLLEPPSAESVLGRLEQRTGGAADIPAGQRGTSHEHLKAEADRLDGLLRARVDRETPAEIVGGDEQRNLMVRLIREARTQLVIAGPWLAYDAISAVLDELVRAADRGVAIVLLWGPDFDTQFEDQQERVRNALYDLQREVPDGPRRRVVLPEVGVGTHAKLLLADDRAALVTSRNLLSSDGRYAELGVLLRAAEGAESVPIGELLRWARTSAPSHDLAQLLTVRHADFASATRLRDEEPSEPEPEIQRPIADIEPPGEEEANSATVRIWADRWKAYVRECRDFLASRTLPDVRVVADATHRDLLWVALRRSTYRLVIASDGVSAEVVDDRFITALRGCLERGISTTLVYGQRNSSGRALALSRLEELRAEFPRLLQLNGPEGTGQARDNHAKVLVWDDEAVIGSFNYLSFEGRYGRQRLASELSLRLIGRRSADAAASACGAAEVSRPPAGEPSAGPPVPPSAAYIAAQRIDAATDSPHPAPIVRDALAEAPDPWQVLDVLDDAMFSDADGDEDAEGGTEPGAGSRDLLRIAVARCLSEHSRQADGTVADRWLSWLINDRWQAGAFVEAAVLRRTLAAPSVRPRSAFALLAAAHRTPVFVRSLEEVAFGLDREERIAGIAAAVGGVLLLGSDQALAVLELWSDALGAEAPTTWPNEAAETWTGTWRELAKNVRAYWHGAYQPVPLNALRDDIGGAQLERSQVEAWHDLDQLLENASSTTFNSTVGSRTHRGLFSVSSGEFAQLREIVGNRSEAALRQWLNTLPTRDMNEFVIAASNRLVPGRESLLGSHLRRFVDRVEPVVRQAERVVEECARNGGTGGAGIPPGTGELARWLGMYWADLEESGEHLPPAEARLTREFLTELEDLVNWGEVHG
ncbi:hypothetical protein GCM10010182_80880 [Actinomadura cremea]|nr:hypothetical protein GCM10010182_80880 [Actinomadura cremea]